MVIAIIAILVGLLLLPPSRKVRAAASARAQSTNNLKQITLATHPTDDAVGYIPNGYTSIPGVWNASIHTILLPYIEQDNLYAHLPGVKPPTTTGRPRRRRRRESKRTCRRATRPTRATTSRKAATTGGYATTAGMRAASTNGT